MGWLHEYICSKEVHSTIRNLQTSHKHCLPPLVLSLPLVNGRIGWEHCGLLCQVTTSTTVSGSQASSLAHLHGYFFPIQFISIMTQFGLLISAGILLNSGRAGEIPQVLRALAVQSGEFEFRS